MFRPALACMVESFCESGEKVILVETPLFRATSQNIGNMVDTLEDKLRGLDRNEVVLILNMLDNSYLKAKGEDGNLIPHSRTMDSCYHINGELVVAPQETVKHLFNQLTGFFRKYQGICKVLLVPLPRYLRQACCSDVDHGPNIIQDGHVDVMLEALAATYTLWRGMAFREKLPNLKVINTGQLLREETWWRGDPYQGGVQQSG
jgi:hypothetical protein